ncbi:MAG: FAD-binding protein [Sulfolobaceae archaeon]
MNLREELEKRFGEKFSDSLLERLAHSADMGFVPHLTWAGIKINTIPDYVVYPEDVEDVIDIVKIARKYNVPIVPYGRATNRYGNAIPTEGGIVVDFSRMDKVEVDEKEKIAHVEPGATWKIVDLYAQQKGLQLRTFPSSYDSTIGGGIAGDALGIGSYEYGFICDNVSYVHMVNPKGELIKLEGKDLAIVCGAEGTTGLITKAGIKLRSFNVTEALVVPIDNLEGVIKAISLFYKEAVPAWHVQIRGPAISTYIAEKYKINLQPGKWNMVILYPTSRATLVEPKVNVIATYLSTKPMETEWTGWWNFNHGVVAALRTKHLLIHQHGLLHFSNLYKFIKDLEKYLGSLGKLEANEGFDLDIALERREILLVNTFTAVSLQPQDKKLIYDLAKNTLMANAFIENGGSMLSIGMFLHKWAKNRLSVMSKTFQDLGVDRYEYMRRYKEEMDPEELFNPGKVFEPKKRGKVVFEIVRRQNEALRFRFGIGFVKAITPRGEVEGYKVARKYLDIFADYAMACIDCGMCVTVCPQFRLIPNQPYAPKGMFDFVKGAISHYELRGSIDIPDSFIAEISGCHKCGLCDGVCPAKIPISTLLVRLNSLVAKKLPETTPVEIPIPTIDVNDVSDNNSNIVLWIGRNMAEQIGLITLIIKLLKQLNLKLKIIGTKYDSGFLDYISGNGNTLIEKIRKNLEVLGNAIEIITLTPEDYKVFSEAYKDFGKIGGIEFLAEIMPIEIRLIKLLKIEGKGEEINLHVACFSNQYANEIIKRLREEGFKVKKIEGCAGATLEKNLGRRADMMARALGERYNEIVTLCPLAAAKFRSVGVNAMTLIEFIAKKLGLQVTTTEPIRIEITEEDIRRIQKVFMSKLQESLLARVNLIVDTLSFTTSGTEDYKKIIEPLIVEALYDAISNMSPILDEIISKKTKEITSPDLASFVRSKIYIDASRIMAQVVLDNIVENFAKVIRESTKEEYDENVLKTTVIEILRDNLPKIKDWLASK